MKRKNIYLISLLLLSLLMTACGGAGTGNTTAGETESEMVSDTQISGSGFYGTYEQSFDIYDDAGVHIRMVPAKDPDNGDIYYAFFCDNNSEYAINVELSACILNGNVYLDDNISFRLDQGASDVEYVTFISEIMDQLDIDQMESLEGQLSINEQWLSADSEPVEIYEGPFAIDTSDMLPPVVTWEPYLEARAEEQVLVETEEVRVTLLGLGYFLDDHYMQTLRAIVMFENLTTHEVLAGIDGIAINRQNFSLSDNDIFEIPAGQKNIQYVYVNDLKDSGLESIYDVSLMILTDEKELTGTVNYSGGSWYPVNLSRSGEIPADADLGTLIFDEEDVQIYYVGRSREAHSEWSSFEAEYGYDWQILVVNNSDENIELFISDYHIDGEKVDTDKEFISAGFDREIGAHLTRYITISDNYYMGSNDYPELSFNVQIRSLGGGYIVYSDNELVTLGEPPVVEMETETETDSESVLNSENAVEESILMEEESMMESESDLELIQN